jgi:hypothetical protein
MCKYFFGKKNMLACLLVFHGGIKMLSPFDAANINLNS